MKKLLVVVFACGIAGCMTEESTDLEEAVTDGDVISKLEVTTSLSDESTLGKADHELVSPAFAACGKAGPNLENRRVNDAASPNAANQRSGSSTGCVALGVLQPSDDAIYFCFTVSGSSTWTYLQSQRTPFVRGWVLDDLLRLNANGTRGSVRHCGF